MAKILRFPIRPAAEAEAATRDTPEAEHGDPSPKPIRARSMTAAARARAWRYHRRALRERLRNRAAAAGVPFADYVTRALWRAVRQNNGTGFIVAGRTLARVQAAAKQANKTVGDWATDALRQAAERADREEIVVVLPRRGELRNRAAAVGVPFADYVTGALWRAVSRQAAALVSDSDDRLAETPGRKGQP